MMKKNVPKPPASHKFHSCLNLAKIMLAALPSFIFGVFTIVFTLQQNYASQKNREQDQKQADERGIRHTFENYIDGVSALLLSRRFNRSDPEHLLHIRVKTLTVLRHVDAARKREIIAFLYESRLLRSDLPKHQRLDLRSANLSNIHFTSLPNAKIDLSYLYLPGVDITNARFIWCNLNMAVFDDSWMENTKIMSSTIENASFYRIFAPRLTLYDVSFGGNNFRDATLNDAEICGALDVRRGVDFTNADLYSPEKPTRMQDFRKILDHHLVTLVNTRLPNGSFTRIDDSDLVNDGRAEQMVSEHCFFFVRHSSVTDNA
jgi:uncharacterized protein YjbI with pentapeptide repeats